MRVLADAEIGQFERAASGGLLAAGLIIRPLP